MASSEIFSSDEYVTNQRSHGSALRPSLFGTTLQRHTLQDQDRKKSVHYNVHQHTMAASKCQPYRLPDHLNDLVTGRDELNSMRLQLKEQEQRASRATHNLKTLEEMYKYFKVDEVSSSCNYPPKCLSVAFEPNFTTPINHMHNGRILGKRYSGNTSVTQPFHLDHSASCHLQQKQLRTYLPTNSLPQATDISSKHKRSSSISQTAFSHLPEFKENLVRLPDSLTERYGRQLLPSIQHRYGTQVCRNLFSDPDFLKQSANTYDPSVQSPKQSEEPATKDFPCLEDGYQSLGQLLRYNLGHTYGPQYDKGVTQTDFNSSVHTRHVPSTNHHRYLKDYLDIWAEQDIIRNRTTKMWTERQMEINATKKEKQEKIF